jgi:predicted metal-binding protein
VFMAELLNRHSVRGRTSTRIEGSRPLGTQRVASINIVFEDQKAASARAETSITIFVCITCRGGRPLDLPPPYPPPLAGEGREGETLAEATARAAAGTGITVRRVRCLANCNRGLSAAVRRDGAWTYVFGNLDAATGAGVLIEGARLFAHSPDGLMPWRGRPDALKRGLVARTPPFEFAGEPE